MINVTRSSMPPFEEYCEEIKDIWESRWLTNNGVKHRELEAKLCEYLKVDNTTLFVNGHMALEMAIRHLLVWGIDIPEKKKMVWTDNLRVRYNPLDI